MDAFTQTILNSLEVTSGCTEPAAIAFCASLAGKHLGEDPQSLHLKIDQRTYKNAFGAGIPNAGELRGSEWALLFGFIMGCPGKRLSIFSELNAETINRARELQKRDLITTELLDLETLFIGITATGTHHTVEAAIQASHTHVARLIVDGRVIMDDNAPEATAPSKTSEFDISTYLPEKWPGLVEKLFAAETLRLTVRQGIDYNMAAAEYGRKYIRGGGDVDALVMGAIYARMNGDSIPVMSCAGSGNKGLTCMIPVVVHVRNNQLGETQELKGVMVSILLTVLITSRFGEVSSVCGAQYAAGAGIIGGLLYLKNRLDLFSGAYNNFISAIGGGFCDGAKGSCSMRGNVAVSTALTSINHAENGFIVSGRDGFLGDTFKETLDHLTRYNPLVARFERETIDILRNK